MALTPKIFPWYFTPATPDLGCIVRNEHPFEVDSNFFLWMEYTPWEIVGGALRYIPHQVYFRVKCGKAAFHQRVSVWMSPANSAPPPLTGLPPDYVLGGPFAPGPSDWLKFPVQSGVKDYWFAGEHKPPTESNWRRDAAVGHSFDRYDNGTLSTVGWDDTGGDRDFNDFILEVAVVYRRNYFDDLQPTVLTADELALLERDVLPKVRASPKFPPASAKSS